MTIGAVLFDLDGTLVDTAPDLVAVVNRLLAEHERPPLSFAIARNEVSNGAVGLIRLAFGPDLPAPALEALRTRFLEIYLANLCNFSRLFSGLEWVHDNSHEYCARWGVVTNKPRAMTEPLLAALGLGKLTGAVVSGDSLPQRKPHPAPLLLAAEQLGLAPRACVYVGDAARDIEAGRAAGMRTVAAAWGYIRPASEPSAWGADALARHPRELLGMLNRLDSDRP